MLLALIMVSFINRVQERRRLRRLQQRRLRQQLAILEEVLTCLEQTLANSVIAKLINDEILDRLQRVLQLENGNTEHIETSIRNAEARGEKMISSRRVEKPSYQKESDVLVAQSRLYINEARKVLRHRFGLGHIGEDELEIYLGELAWAHLMVGVVSLIIQGHKATARGDMFSAHAYYQKAQYQLMESSHPDQRRMRMIRELGEILSGTREQLSTDLMPDP